MIDKDINKSMLCEVAEISAGTIAKMSKDEPVGLNALERFFMSLL